MTLVTGESNSPDPECPALTNRLATPGTLPTWQCHNDVLIRPEAKSSSTGLMLTATGSEAGGRICSICERQKQGKHAEIAS